MEGAGEGGKGPPGGRVGGGGGGETQFGWVF